MPEIQASRRLVKSPPELWTEVSDATSLARHLGEVGEIRITRLEPETTVAWEGEHASGTVELAPAGWGTSVTLTAEPVAAAEPEPEPVEPEAEPEAEPDAEPEAEPEATAGPESTAEPEPTAEPEAAAEAEPKPARRGWFARLFKRHTVEPKPVHADRAGGAGETISAAPPAESSGRAGSDRPARSSAEPEQEQQPTPEPDPLEAVLVGALDSLGQAHHRPFSRG